MTSSFSRTLQLTQFGIGTGLSTVLILSGYHVLDLPLPHSPAPWDKVLYTLRWSLPMVLVVMLAVQRVAMGRVNTAAINPLAGMDHLIQLQKNFLSSSVEQCLVMFVLLLIMATYVEEVSNMVFVPLFVINFVVGRILFRVGYGIGPEYRGVGVVMTFVPAAVLACGCCYATLTKGFGFGVGDETLSSSFGY